MSEALQVALKALGGGSFVVLFSLIAEGISPKAYSGIFGGAPSVALSSLAVTVVMGSSAMAREAAAGMISGSIAMVAYMVALRSTLGRDASVVTATIACWAVWAVVATAAYLVLFH
jgi:uncharacterized membrane protein